MLSKLKDLLKDKFTRDIDEYDIDKEKMNELVKKGAILLDTRSPQEYEEGHLDGAILIPEYELNKRAEKELSDKDSIIIVYCQTGSRSNKAKKLLQKKGYKNVYNLYGGLDNN